MKKNYFILAAMVGVALISCTGDDFADSSPTQVQEQESPIMFGSSSKAFTRADYTGAAAAELRSQFTIPERCQTIILTRGEGRTAMPPKEKLYMLASHQSTMCIFLSASIVDEVQRHLLDGGYPPETPVAVCYKLTWKDQRIFRGQLKDLASILKDNNLSLTTLIVVGEAIDNRHGLSKLYDSHFTHMFRKGIE